MISAAPLRAPGGSLSFYSSTYALKDGRKAKRRGARRLSREAELAKVPPLELAHAGTTGHEGHIARALGLPAPREFQRTNGEGASPAARAPVLLKGAAAGECLTPPCHWYRQVT